MSETSEVDMKELREAMVEIITNLDACAAAYRHAREATDEDERQRRIGKCSRLTEKRDILRRQHFATLLAAADALLRRGESRPATEEDTQRLDWLDERVRLGGVPFVTYDVVSGEQLWVAGFGSPLVVELGESGEHYWTGATIREAMDNCRIALDRKWAADKAAIGTAPAAHEGEARPVCGLCGEPMPPGEEMFTVHGYSGPCPMMPPERTPTPANAPDAAREGISETVRELADFLEASLGAIAHEYPLEVRRAEELIDRARSIAARPAPQAKGSET